MTDFTLHPTLVADCHDLGVWHDLCVLLHKNAQVRWFILVPKTQVADWHELPGSLHRQLLAASTVLARMLRVEDGCDKVNVAAIGNLVPQFHYHVVGRRRTDPYWPGVVWGRTEPTAPYAPGEIDELARRVEQVLRRAME
jgi:diadenosine tetraphosphate (Ap4A) HIT family hydrolase